MIRQFNLVVPTASYEPMDTASMWFRDTHYPVVSVATKDGIYAGVPVYVFMISEPKFEIMALKETIDKMSEGEQIAFIRREVEHATRKQSDLELQLSNLYRERTLFEIRSNDLGIPISTRNR